MRAKLFLGAALLATAACSGETDPLEDAGPDAGEVTDAGTPDAGHDAGGPRPDAGTQTPVDAGFQDPATLLAGFNRIGGVRMWIHLRGTTTSTMPPVLFFAAGPMLGTDYLIDQTEFLLGPGGAQDPNRLLVYFDLRATGRSGFGTATSTGTRDMVVTPENHVYDTHNVVAFVREQLGRDDRVDLVGHGYGAGIAALYAAQHPENVSRTVLIAPYPSNVYEQADFMAEWNARLSRGDREQIEVLTQWHTCLRDLNRCSLEVWNVIGPSWLCARNRDRFYDMRFLWAEVRAWRLFIIPYLTDNQYDWAPAFTRVQAPTTVISGPCDPVPASAALTYSSSIAGARHHILPDTGHFPMVEARDDFRRIVSEALTYP